MLNDNKTMAADVAAIDAIVVVPQILRILCEITGMKFAVIARVSESNWTACAVLDELGMGLEAGQELDIGTTFCQEVRASRAAIVIDSVKDDVRYRDHLTPKIYGFQSYISVPIVLPDGYYFGSLCTLDRRAISVSDLRIRFMFMCFAGLLAEELQRARSCPGSGEPTSRAQVENLRSLVIAMLTADEPGGAAADVDSAARHFLSRLASSLNHDSPLIADALTLTRTPICAGSRVNPRQCTDLVMRLRSVVTASRLAHPDRQIISNIVLGRPVYCDPHWIERLASCLLECALRHGNRSSAVSFIAKVKANSLLISVWNSGDTILPEELATLFRPNWRSMHDPATEGAEMHLCAEVVRAHSGTMEATSSSGNGTQLTARIPLRPRAA